MALVKATVKKAIQDLLEEMLTITDSEEGVDIYADKFAQLIIDTIKSGEVVVNLGIPVAVVPTTGIGATTSAGSGSII